MSDTNTEESDFHLGRLIRAELDRQNLSIKWFAHSISCSRPNCYCIFERQYIDIELLKRICQALRHNFFIELAEHMGSVIKD
ncbi:MAG: XRE family transcriptional regulator [Bacteroidales bacterium]|nr:XRE family transcriptional regulator [Bacteroidales bacterium]MBR4624327.1 XRE family transcriptional regulator [Alphaproteobacteria bacterium]